MTSNREQPISEQYLALVFVADCVKFCYSLV